MDDREPEADPRVLAWVRVSLDAVPPSVQDATLAGVPGITLPVDLARSTVDPDGPFRAPDPLGYVLVGLLVLPLAWRRRHPMAVFTVVLVDAVVVAAIVYRPTSYGFGLIIATYTVGQRAVESERARIARELQMPSARRSA